MNLKNSLTAILFVAFIGAGCGFRTISEVEWAECKGLRSGRLWPGL